MSDSFPPLFTGIQEMAVELHEMGNRLSILALADDRGYLNEIEQKEMQTLSTSSNPRAEELDTMIAIAARLHGPEWRQFLKERIVLLARVGDALRSTPVSIGGVSPGFLDALLPDLFAGLSALLNGEQGRHTVAWALAVSKSIVDDWKRMQSKPV